VHRALFYRPFSCQDEPVVVSGRFAVRQIPLPVKCRSSCSSETDTDRQAMRTLRIVGIGTAILALPILGLIAYGSWETAHLVYPSPENESAFLHAYDSKAVVQPFMANEGFHEGRERGGGAGRKFVTHSACFYEYFAMQADRADSMMTAVNDDVLHRLILSRARILDQSGTSSAGFRYEYALGNSIGNISIRPLAPGAIHCNIPLPDGLKDVSLSIDVREEWFPQGVPLGVSRLLPDSDK